MEVSQLIWEQKRAAGFRCDQNWHIGYFSGSHSHNRDFALVAEPLASLMRQDPRVILRVVGFLELGGAFEGFEGRVERFELQETADLQWLIGEVNVSISPLQDNVFTKCKSDLKWFEAAVAGTVTVASPSGGWARGSLMGQTASSPAPTIGTRYWVTWWVRGLPAGGWRKRPGPRRWPSALPPSSCPASDR